MTSYFNESIPFFHQLNDKYIKIFKTILTNIVFIVKFSFSLTYGQKCMSKESGLVLKNLKIKVLI